MGMQLTDDFTKRILVVEDEGLIAVDLQSRLARLGYPLPVIANSGEDALRCVRSTCFDLVLMDIRLKGGMDGISTARALRAERATPVVYLTAHSDPETLNRARLTEPLGYLIKPVRDADLRSTVRVALHKAEMERRLRASEAWLANTLRSVGEGILATDAQGDIVFLNPVAERLTGWPAAEAQGRPLGEVLLEAEAAPAPAGASGCARVSTLVSRSGDRAVVELEAFENRADGDRLGSIVVVRDIGARREMERRLIQSQRMEAIANLAGGLAHDFNNQLTLILGCADELGRRLSGDDQKRALDIKQAASIAASSTGQLLTLSRREAAHREVLNLDEIICELQPLISHSLGTNRTLATHLGSSVGPIYADRNQLKQVLLNLAFNARDATPSGGELRLATSTVEIEPGSPAARSCPPGRYVRLEVTDTGQGMEQATLARIFEPFFTTKRAGRGTGLGLSMVHSIIVQSGGYISATSEPGRGTSFEILLPCYRAPRRLPVAPAEAVISDTERRTA